MVLLAVLLSAPAGNAAELRRLWCRPLEAEGVEVADDRVFAHGPTGVTALDARTGRTIWEQPLAADGAAIAVVGPRVAVGVGPELLWLDARLGAVLDRVALALPVRRILTAPMVVVTQGPTGAALVAMDDEGRPAAVLAVGREIYDAVLHDGNLVAIVGHGDDQPIELQGVDPFTLAPRWRRQFTVAARFYERGATLLVHRWTLEQGRLFLPLDAASGVLGEPLPPRALSVGYEDLTWELQASPEPPVVRRAGGDGLPRWKAPLPAAADGWAVTRKHLVIHADPWLLALEMESGALVGRSFQPGPVSEIVANTGIAIVLVDGDGIVAFELPE